MTVKDLLAYAYG
jgi:hypothetical protein